MVDISVVIATYNRADILKDTLDCLLAQRTNGVFIYEMIIADNNSNDHTRKVVASYSARFQGRLTYLFVPQQGKSYALNQALTVATGEIISFVDDDCILGEDYLLNIKSMFDEYGAQVDILGGRILPKWMGGNCPGWLSGLFAQPAILENGDFNWNKIGFEGVLGIMDFGDKSFILDYADKNHPDIQFFGANMAFRSKVLKQWGNFNIAKRFSQDTEICQRFFNAGVKGVYAPKACLYHRISISKGRPIFYYRWWFQRGQYADITENLSFNLILKMIRLLKNSFAKKDFIQKVHLRTRAFYYLGQVMKVS